METNIATIDGSQGEGGGQIFRTTLTLALCLQRAVHIVNIRAGRKNPGLLRQHLTCLRAAQEIANAKVVGDALGSTEVFFRPGKVTPGTYRFAIGSAGSTTLVFQSVLLPLLFAESESTLYLEGGTHNGAAPSFDFIDCTFLPLLIRMGYQVGVELERYGFYPAGGGAWRARIVPGGEKHALALTKRGEIRSLAALATSARLPAHVTERELRHIQRKCGLSATQMEQKLVDSVGPGNIVSLRVSFPLLSEAFEEVGERGVSAERVAGKVVKTWRRFANSGALVGEHLADQLLLPMLLARGGCFRTLAPSQHLLTNIDVIKQLTGINIGLNELAHDLWEVGVPEMRLNT